MGSFDQECQKLSPKKARFVREYLVDLNATQAAIRAGYSEKSANTQGPRLLGNDGVKAAIDAGLKERNKKVGLSQEYVIENLMEIVERTMQRAPVMTMKGEQVQDEDGRNVWQFNSRDANKALELLGKHLGIFTDKVESTTEADITYRWKE